MVKKSSNFVASEKPKSGTYYFRENPGKAALALVLSLVAGFIVGVAVHLFLVTFVSLESYLSVGFSSPASVVTALYLNRVIRSLIKRYNTK